MIEGKGKVSLARPKEKGDKRRKRGADTRVRAAQTRQAINSEG